MMEVIVGARDWELGGAVAAAYATHRSSRQPGSESSREMRPDGGGGGGGNGGNIGGGDGGGTAATGMPPAFARCGRLSFLDSDYDHEGGGGGCEGRRVGDSFLMQSYGECFAAAPCGSGRTYGDNEYVQNDAGAAVAHCTGSGADVCGAAQTE